MNFNFGEVLTRAWQIIWKHKVLWIFGILAGCGRGGTRFNSSSRGGGGDGGFGQLPPEILRILQTIQENLTAFIVAGCILFLLIWAVTIFLGTIGKVGLIRGAFQADEGAEKLIFGQLFSESTPYFWRVFGLSLLVALPIFVVFVALVAGALAWAISITNDGPAGSGTGFAAVGLILLCTICFLVPVSFVIGMIARQAENAIVLEDMRVLPALSRGWDVFRANLGPIILMAIILAVIALVIGFVIALPVIVIVFPSVIAFAAGDRQNWTPLIWMTIGLCIYTPILLVLNGIMTAYLESVWTLTYMRLTAKPLDNAPVVLEANA
jgi:hypothetical protein